MNVVSFVNSLYLGDRACKRINIDTWKCCISIHINPISRLNPDIKNWNFYDSEDIEHGRIVFDRVESFSFSPNGLIPNDSINDFTVEILKPGLYCFNIFISSVDNNGNHSEVKLEIIAHDIYLIDPKKEGQEIR